MDAGKIRYPKLTQAINQLGVNFPEALSGKFARILQQIEQTWGSKDAVRYLDSLILENREDRQGFPLEVIREIISIKQTHDFLFPSLDNNPFDPFSAARTLPLAKKAPAPDAADLIEFTSQPAQDLNLKRNAPDEAVTTPSATASLPPPADAQATDSQTERRVSWPKAHTQHELIEYARLLHSGDGRIHAQQGNTLGEILTHYNLADERTLNMVNHIQGRPQNQNKAIGRILVEIGIISDEELA